jgi:soluble lytic murein transglycosylase-like protein
VTRLKDVSKLIGALAIAGIVPAAATQALAAPGDGDGTPARGELAVLHQPVEQLERSIDVHRARERYRAALASARRADVVPGSNLLADRSATPPALRDAAERLTSRARRAGDSGGSVAIAPPERYGVSQATLDGIASCESGGDPGAISAGGDYRGKYQFDTGTWASVGGSGDPATAPEAEQDMRAAILYSRAGSSPWPVCG